MVYSSRAISQQLGVYNADQKMIYKIKAGKELDFRIDYKKLYPEKGDSVLESRVFGLIDSISGEDIYLIENIIVLNFTKTESNLVETEYEYTSLTINLRDIKSLSFTPTAASIGNALWFVGLATMVISPLLGITPDGFSSGRLLTTASIGAGTALVGGTLKWTFGQKPVKIKDFDGPDYFKKYQRGSISMLQQGPR
jgi:hypothetical protein